MKLLILQLIGFLLMPFYLFAGDTDSLRQFIQQHPSAPESLEAYASLLSRLYDQENDSLLMEAESYLSLAEELASPIHQIYALEYQAFYYDFFKSDIPASLNKFQKALELAGKYEVDYDQDLYYDIAILFHVSDDYDKALDYYQRAIESASSQDLDFIQHILANMGSIQSSLGHYDQAEKHFLRAIAIESTEKEALIAAYSNLGNMYVRKGNPEEAIIYLAEAIKIQQTTDHPDDLFDASYLIDAKVASKSTDQLDTLLQYVVDRESTVQDLRLQTILYKSVYSGYQLLGEYEKASLFQDKYIAGYDSLITSQRYDLTSELEAKYDNEKKKAEIAELEVAQQKAEYERNIWLLIAIMVVPIAILLFVLLRTKSRSNAIISKSLEEKEILLKEIHHRVKNNLQVVSSLLSMQSRFIEDEAALGAVSEGRSRVESIALIHQKLYQKDNLTGVRAKDYILDLTDTLITTYHVGDEIDIDMDVDDLNIDVDTIIPIGLILNELISNSLKHGLSNSSEGKLAISLKQKQETLYMKVANSQAKAAKIPNQKKATFGKILIESLAEKLQAKVILTNEEEYLTELYISNYKLAE